MIVDQMQIQLCCNALDKQPSNSVGKKAAAELQFYELVDAVVMLSERQMENCFCPKNAKRPETYCNGCKLLYKIWGTRLPGRAPEGIKPKPELAPVEDK